MVMGAHAVPKPREAPRFGEKVTRRGEEGDEWRLTSRERLAKNDADEESVNGVQVPEKALVLVTHRLKINKKISYASTNYI
jgi:hypothetical protein